jgi:hypothetical protein
MPVTTQAKTLGELLKYEAPNLYSRETVTIAAGQNLKLGTVLGRSMVDNKYRAFDPNDTNGLATAVGVLCLDVDATVADREEAIMVARHAIVARGALIWPAGISDQQVTDALQDLEERGILVRDSA